MRERAEEIHLSAEPAGRVDDSLSAGGADLQMKKRYVRADGSRVRTRERVSAIRDADGTPTSLLLVSFDEDASA